MKLQATRVVLEDVTKRFGQTLAVDRVSLEIEPGEMVTFLGPSGCGKTTTLRIVAGLETATDGRVFIGEADVTHLPPNARDVTMMFQSYALFPHLSVFENVAYGLRVLRRPDAEIRQALQEVLELVGMPGMERRSPSALSGGQHSGWPSQDPWCCIPRCCCSTSPCRTLMRSSASGCARKFAFCISASASPQSTSPMTRLRHWPSRIGSWSWIGAASRRSSRVFIGREDSNNNRFFSGLIDEPTIYGRALADAEILAIYSAGGNGKCGAAPTTDTNTSVSLSPDSSVYGQPVTFTSAVSSASSSGVPTGTVQFYADKAPLSGAQDVIDGVATLTTNTSTVGAHVITATYSGDSIFNGSSSKGAELKVSKAKTFTQITSHTPSSTVAGQPYTVNFTIGAEAPSTAIPIGTVTVIDGTGQSCTASLADGLGSCVITSTTVAVKAYPRHTAAAVTSVLARVHRHRIPWVWPVRQQPFQRAQVPRTLV